MALNILETDLSCRAMSELTHVDITRWNRKVKEVIADVGEELKKTLAYGNTKLAGAVTKNLAGSAYYPGKLPVRRVTGTLARAYRVNKQTDYLYAHGMDRNVANYAVYVHYGTRYLKPRPYFKDAVNSQKPAILNYWRYQLILAARKKGQA